MRQNDPLKVYISGPITSDCQAEAKFAKAELALRDVGFVVVNPFSIHSGEVKSWSDYMREDIKALMDCDALCSLDFWTTSRGARIERSVAGELALLIFEGIEGARFWMEMKKRNAA